MRQHQNHSMMLFIKKHRLANCWRDGRRGGQTDRWMGGGTDRQTDKETGIGTNQDGPTDPPTAMG